MKRKYVKLFEEFVNDMEKNSLDELIQKLKNGGAISGTLNDIMLEIIETDIDAQRMEDRGKNLFEYISDKTGVPIEKLKSMKFVLTSTEDVEYDHEEILANLGDVYGSDEEFQYDNLYISSSIEESHLVVKLRESNVSLTAYLISLNAV